MVDVLTVLSAPPLMRHCPSGLSATDRTQWECPARVRIGSPVSRFHSLISLSAPPLARTLLSGLKATEKTQSEWLRVWKGSPLGSFHTLMVLSKPPLARRLPSGSKVTELILPTCPASVPTGRP